MVGPVRAGAGTRAPGGESAGPAGVAAGIAAAGELGERLSRGVSGTWGRLAGVPTTGPAPDWGWGGPQEAGVCERRHLRAAAEQSPRSGCGSAAAPGLWER